jgi:hypothetical protein
VRRVTVEEIIRDEPNVQFQPGDSYLLSYPEFIAYFANLDQITQHNVIIAANFTYGWMPRILTFKSQDLAGAVGVLNAARGETLITECELGLLRNLIDNSLVAVSKLLHFVNPRRYAIWDRRVYTYISGRCSQAQIQKPRNYLEFLDNCREITSDRRFEPAYASMNRKIGYGVTSYRALELVMYWNGNRQPQATGRRAHRRGHWGQKMVSHEVYAAIVSAVRSGELQEPFSPAGFRRACPGFGEGTYRAFLYKHRLGNQGGSTELFELVRPGRFSLLRPIRYGL